MAAHVGSFNVHHASAAATNQLDKALLCMADAAGMGRRLAFLGGQPTDLYQRLMALKALGYRNFGEVKRAIERMAGCPYCGGATFTRPTCPNCGAEPERD